MGDEKIVLGKAKFELAIEEQNGFNPYLTNFTFNTEPKSEPKLEIVDYAIDDDNKNGKIEQNEKFDLYVLVQNKGAGDEKNVIFDAIANGNFELIKKIASIDKIDINTFGKKRKFESMLDEL